MVDYETFWNYALGTVCAWVCLPEDEDGDYAVDVEFAIHYEKPESTGHGSEGDIVYVEGFHVHEFGRIYSFSMDEFGEIADEVEEAVEIEYRSQEVEYDG